MRAFLVFKKCLRQQLRDKTGLALSLFTVPFFALFYWLFFSGQAVSYKLIVYSENQTVTAEATATHYDRELINHLKKLTLNTDSGKFDIDVTDNFSTFNQTLINGEAAAGLIIPDGFSRAVADSNRQPEVTLTGDGSLPSYYSAKALVRLVLSGFPVKQQAPPPIEIREKLMGLSSDRSPFETCIPGLLVFAVIMLIFSSSMAVSREIESCTIDRLRMTPLTTVDLLAGISAVQILQGLFSVMLTFIVAAALGYRSAGSISYAFFISVTACFASIGIGMVVAGISKTQNRAFLISSVAMFLLILFSGILFPRPDMTLFYIGNHPVNCFDFLPTTHMAKGLEKVLTLGVSPVDLVYETGGLIFLSILYFGAGVLFFSRSGSAATE